MGFSKISAAIRAAHSTSSTMAGTTITDRNRASTVANTATAEQRARGKPLSGLHWKSSKVVGKFTSLERFSLI